jgi:hypothetical protein
VIECRVLRRAARAAPRRGAHASRSQRRSAFYVRISLITLHSVLPIAMLRFMSVLAVFVSIGALDNGLARTPPMGWVR